MLELEYTERIIETNDWATYLLLLCFLLMAMAKYFYPRRFEDFVSLPISNKYFKTHAKEDAIQHPFNILFFAVQVICVSLFAYLLIESFAPKLIEENPWVFVQISTVYAVFVLAKVSIEKIVGNIFSIDALIDTYLYQKLSYRNLLTLLLFCGNLFFLYIFPSQGLALLIFAIVILVLNAVALFFTYKKNGILIASNFFYFILYLCALEISPYVILYKMFITDGII